MSGLPAQQKGASAIATIIVLVILAYGVYVGIQYVPQFMESKTVDSILKKIDDDNRKDPIDNTQAAESALVNLLQFNDLEFNSDNYTVKQVDNRITIEFSYDRKLDLIYKVLPMQYEKKLTLN